MMKDKALLIGSGIVLASADLVLSNQLPIAAANDLGSARRLALHVHITSQLVGTFASIQFSLGTAGGFVFACTGAIPKAAALTNTHWYALLSPWPQGDPTAGGQAPTLSDSQLIFALATLDPDRAGGAAKGTCTGTFDLDIVEMPAVTPRVYPANVMIP